jgi:hypothetical protein
MDPEDIKVDAVVKEEGQAEAVTPEYNEDEQAALAKGWKPKDQWEGAEDEWKPAKVFNEIGRLKDETSRLSSDLKKLNKVNQLMKDHHVRVRQSAYEEALKTLKAERVKALQDDDFAKAEVIRDKIDDVRTRFETDSSLPREIEQEIRAATVQPDPELYAFMDRNPWYKPGTKDEMTVEADTLGAAYKLKNPDAPYTQLIAYVEKRVRQLYPEKFERPRNPVNDGGSRGSNSGGGSGKVQLTDQEREIARSFGMTDAQYAKEMQSYKGR